MARFTRPNRFRNPLPKRLWAMIALLGCLLPLHAQPAWQPVELANYAHGIQGMGISGDTLFFQLTLGEVDAPAMSVGGFEVRFTFPKLQSAPDQVLAMVAGTWLSEGLEDPEAASAYDSKEQRLSVAYGRADASTVSGHGSILRVCLVREGGFAPSEAATCLSDGIVMVDNINLRMTSGADHSSSQPGMLPIPPANSRVRLAVAPNPATDDLDVNVTDPQGCTLRLWTLQGTPLQTQACEQGQRLDLRQLPAGTYLLTLDGPGFKEARWIVRR